MPAPPLTAQPAVRLAIAVGVQFVLAAVVAALLSGEAGVLLYLLVSSLLARTLRRGRALVIGVTGWAFATGFAVHRFGLLTFTEPDLVRLVVFLLAAAILARHGHPQ